MDIALIGKFLEVNGPWGLIVMLLIIGWSERKENLKTIGDYSSVIATLNAMSQNLSQLCQRFDRMSERSPH